ncbi:hypothetical protein ABZ923_33800 [Streptomyces sp. NPDC046881]|uniref:hypothetical protein n=1 Tax=Streptomyces sp. NPDC046881 TaxID=3155374 RepID=UPI0034117A00
MPASVPTRSLTAVRRPLAAPVPAPACPALYDGPRIMAADFFPLARTGRAQTTLPPFRDGNSVSCPLGNEWMRHDGRWIVPGRPA